MVKREAQKTKATDAQGEDRSADLAIKRARRRGGQAVRLGDQYRYRARAAGAGLRPSNGARSILAEPIKQLGDFTVPVKLEPEVEASLKVKVDGGDEA